MSKRRRKKVAPAPQIGAAELNIMPFIDIFSMLNTFLLVSATFIGLGILEVQVPFLSNAPDAKEEESEPQRTLDLKININIENIEVETAYSLAPKDENTEIYKLDADGLERLHVDMITLKQNNLEADKATLFVNDNVKYSEVVGVVDAIKTLREDDPVIPMYNKELREPDPTRKAMFLFEKVVIGSVIL